MDLADKRRVGRTRMDQDGVRPGGRRVGRILRFAEADTASASAFRLCASNTALARNGLAVLSPQSGRHGQPPFRSFGGEAAKWQQHPLHSKPR